MFKTTKAKVIFVTVFCVICILITLSLILYQNIEIEAENENSVEEYSARKKDVSGIDIKGTYNQNDLIINEKKVSKEKVEIRYCQIDGLKNKTIQDKINNELETVALNFYREDVKDLNKVLNVQVNMSNTSNFANTISFELAYTAKIDDDGDGFYQGFKGLNYDLTTGEKITLNKLFTSDAPIEDILRQSAYYSLIQYNLEDNLSGDLVVSDYGDIEDEISNFINQYKKGKITDFYFLSNYINIYYTEKNIIQIDMTKYTDYIAIYSRYITNESIFEVDNIGLKNLYTLSERYIDSGFRKAIYEKGTNYFIDINIDNYDGYENEFSQKLAQQKIEEIEEEIEKVKGLASKDANSFYILNYYINISTTYELSTEQNLTNYSEVGNSYEMTKNDFEENIEPIIMKYNRADLSGQLPTYVYDFSDMLRIAPQETREYYNPETGDKIVV